MYPGCRKNVRLKYVAVPHQAITFARISTKPTVNFSYKSTVGRLRPLQQKQQEQLQKIGGVRFVGRPCVGCLFRGQKIGIGKFRREREPEVFSIRVVFVDPGGRGVLHDPEGLPGLGGTGLPEADV